ncbi:hypothetical protein AS026_00140 [Rhizobium altiplani]|uniref:Uncharacterized protein n=1 Tax=Rhizobium altiplani TaxID=1864509 RepID=A0A109K3P8_9HYPH|nr:hypothetical protein AS026_00140 [Rhizobium altiplani]
MRAVQRLFWHWMGPDVEAEGLGRFPAAIAQAKSPLVLRLVTRKRGAGQEHRNNDVAISRTIPCHADRLTNDAAYWRQVSPTLAHRTSVREMLRDRIEIGSAAMVPARGAWSPTLPMATSETPEIAGNGGYGLAGCVWPKPARPAEKAKGQHPMKKRARPA